MMNKNFYNLVKENKYDKVNKLIELDIINMNYAVEEILKTNNAKYIYKFAMDVKGAPIEKLNDTIRKIKLANELGKLERLEKLLASNKIDEIQKSKEEYKKLFYVNEES